jgi:hypothetical protein
MANTGLQLPDHNNDLDRIGNPVTFSWARREVKMISVTEGELDTVASLSNSVDLAFLGMSGGAFLTLLVTVFTVAFSAPFTFAGFIAATIVSGAGTLFFGFRARVAYIDAKRKLGDIKRGETLPK